MSEEIIDLEHLAEVTDGDEEFQKEFIEVYLDDSKNLLAELESLVAQAKWADATRVAHSIKGASGNVGAQKMQQAALQLELCCRKQAESESSPEPSLEDLLSGIKNIYTQTKTRLEQL